MKKLLLPAVCLILFGCTDKKAQQQSRLDSVIAVHEKDMGSDEQLLKNKAVLDSAAKKTPAGALSDSVKLVTDKVIMADSAMDVWMHGFDPDMTKKPLDTNMAYLAKQKKLIMQVDSQLSAALDASTKLIAKNKLK